jgi:hypothetical protein
MGLDFDDKEKELNKKVIFFILASFLISSLLILTGFNLFQATVVLFLSIISFIILNWFKLWNLR